MYMTGLNLATMLRVMISMSIAFIVSGTDGKFYTVNRILSLEGSLKQHQLVEK